RSLVPRAQSGALFQKPHPHFKGGRPPPPPPSPPPPPPPSCVSKETYPSAPGVSGLFLPEKTD
ncbi:hypothetical protein AB0V68_32615, partial [Mesorhizobium ciceri]